VVNRPWDAREVLLDVLTGDHVAAIVARLLELPLEDVLRLGRIGDARGLRAPVDARDVVARRGGPVHVARGEVRVSLDAREGPLDAGTIRLDELAVALVRAPRPDAVHVRKQGHQVFRARENEDVGVLAVAVLRKPAVGPTPNARKRDLPPESERAVAGA